MDRRLHVTIDIGGTFTDLVAYDEASEELLLAKAPSTPPLFIDGVMAALITAGIEPGEIVHFRHGSTIATNAIIERRPVKAGLLTTRGMRDVLGAGRANRPDLFNSNWDPSPPLVPRRHVLEATERVDYEGTILKKLTEEDADGGADLRRPWDRGGRGLVPELVHEPRARDPQPRDPRRRASRRRLRLHLRRDAPRNPRVRAHLDDRRERLSGANRQPVSRRPGESGSRVGIRGRGWSYPLGWWDAFDASGPERAGAHLPIGTGRGCYWRSRHGAGVGIRRS